MFRWIAIAGAIVLVPLIIVLGVVKNQDVESASGESDSPAVLSVDGLRVTEREYSLKVDAVRSNIDYMQGVAATDSPFAEFDEAYAKLIRETGVDVVALAGSITEAVVYQWGIDHGIEVSQAELDAGLDEQREIITTAEDPSVEGRQASIEEVGEDLYWNEIAPRYTRQEIVKRAVYKEQVGDIQKLDEAQATWRAFQTQLILDADIQSLDSDLITDEMIEQAIDCLTVKMPALYAEYPGY